MKSNKILRILGIVIILSLLMAFPAISAYAMPGYEKIDVSPAKGKIGDRINVYGYDFVPGGAVHIYFSSDAAEEGDYLDEEVTAYKLVMLITAGAVGAYNQGQIATYFTVPAKLTDGDAVENVRSGKYYIYAVYPWDERIRSIAEFTIIGGNITIDPVEGHVGTELTISGTGFIADRIVTIKYDGTEVKTTAVKPDGAFSVTFKVPASKYGEHTVTATDGTITKQFTFTMESTAPTVPVPLKPEMGIKAESQAYFDWMDVADPSGVTYTLKIASDEGFTSVVLEKKNLTDSEYTLTKEEELKPVRKKAPYYWRVKAIDGATNESVWSGTGSFYVGTSLTMPQWALYALLGIGAFLVGLLGFWVGRRTAYYRY